MVVFSEPIVAIFAISWLVEGAEMWVRLSPLGWCYWKQVWEKHNHQGRNVIKMPIHGPQTCKPQYPSCFLKALYSDVKFERQIYTYAYHSKLTIKMILVSFNNHYPLWPLSQILPKHIFFDEYNWPTIWLFTIILDSSFADIVSGEQ